MRKKLKKYNPLRYINGVKGAISLFMAVLLIPYLTVAMILVDVGKYNSSVSILDESMSVSANSTLADYDSYLKKRFGMLAVSQKTDIQSKFTEYLETNAGILGEGIQLNTLTVGGDYPLSDIDIIKKQVTEYSKLAAPYKVTTDFADLDSLLSCFDGLKTIQNVVKVFSNTIDAIDNIITLFTSIETLKKTAGALDDLASEYDDNYTAFQDDVNALIDALDEERPEDEEEAKNYDDNIDALINNVNTSKEAYSATLKSVIDKMGEYKDCMSSVFSSVSSIEGDLVSAGSSAIDLQKNLSKNEDKLDNLKKEIKGLEEQGYNGENSKEYSEKIKQRSELESEIAEQQVLKGGYEAKKDGLDSVTKNWADSSKDYNDVAFGDLIKEFQELKGKVDSFDANAVTKNTDKITEDEYKNPSGIRGYVSADKLEEYILKQELSMKTGDLKNLIKGIITFYNSVFSFSGIFDASLSAYIDKSCYMPGDSMDTVYDELINKEKDKNSAFGIIDNIKKLINSIKTFGDKLGKNLITFNWLAILNNLKSIVTDAIGVLTSIASFALTIVERLGRLLYEKGCISAYSAYNFPCRTDHLSGTLSFEALTGYKLNETSLPDQGVLDLNVSHFEEVFALVDAIKTFATGTGDDIAFSGAELEYIIVGSRSEVANQLAVFCLLYVLRFCCDLVAVCKDPEIQSIAAAAAAPTFGASIPVIYVVVGLAEPLADVLLLVNGEDIELLKTDLFLSPSGLPGFLEKLVSVCKFKTEEKDEIKKGFLSAYKTTEEEFDANMKVKGAGKTKSSDKKSWSDKYVGGLLEFDYRQYCYLILTLFVDLDTQVSRISNLTQMESLYYYKHHHAEYEFDLSKSYTCVDAKANVNIKQFLPSLTDSSLFKINRRCFRGY